MSSPLGGQDAHPFYVMGTLGWTWGALDTLRGNVGDEGVLKEMLGRERASELVSDRRYIRVDIELTAQAPQGRPLPLPAPSAWKKWHHEIVERLARVEPLLPEETWRANDMGMTEVLAWQSAPAVTTVCDPEGELRLEAVKTSAFQMIELPIVFDGDEGVGERPQQQLAELFARVRAALLAWMQVLNHLLPPEQGRDSHRQ